MQIVLISLKEEHIALQLTRRGASLKQQVTHTSNTQAHQIVNAEDNRGEITFRILDIPGIHTLERFIRETTNLMI